ncbi:MAG TPA: tetratricopeptide repeat protein [Flavisolibacter sp.]|nr:tetratricopeptide repeat protein [Flavisolibacter sp.]
MKKPQWITAGLALLITVTLYALTQDKVFGHHPKGPSTAPQTDSHAGHDHAKDDHSHQELTIDTLLGMAKNNLPPDQLTRLTFLENSISRGDVTEQKLHVYHQLARFWRDTARLFAPYAWYTAEAARLENSEKSLTFAAHLFLRNLRLEDNQELKHWKGLQAKDLFERSLKLNPDNDSSQVGLGATLLYSGLTENPMEGIMKIRQVTERDSSNAYAQMTLGQASLMSGQLDKAIERFLNVTRSEPNNLEAILALADVYEGKREPKKAVEWYKRSLPHIQIPELRKEVEKRINDLNQ